MCRANFSRVGNRQRTGFSGTTPKLRTCSGHIDRPHEDRSDDATAVIEVMALYDRFGFMAQGSSAPPQTAFGGIDRSVEALVANLRRLPPSALDAPTALRAQD